MELIVTTLALLQLKHFLVDFLLQTPEMVISKGIYMDMLGIVHSLQHAVITVLIITFAVDSVAVGVACGFIDYVLHYHIDFIKVRFGNRDTTDTTFWHHLGLDQLLHQLTYIGLVYAAL